MGVIRQQIEVLEDSPIVEVFRLGVDHPDVIGMWAGEPDVPTPAFICDAASRALAEGRTFYSHNRGTPALRAAIAAYLQRLWNVDVADGRIALTLSGMNAVMLVAQATVQPGDNAVAVDSVLAEHHARDADKRRGRARSASRARQRRLAA